MSATTPYSNFRIHPVTSALGAEIDGIDLNQPLTPEIAAELRRALGEYLVLFFRDQHINDEAQLGLAPRPRECRARPECERAGPRAQRHVGRASHPRPSQSSDRGHG